MFLNLVMLAGLGAAVVPLVLHLLSRSSVRTVDWGAMMFLDGRDPRQVQSARVRQRVLLALRMLLVAVLAAALARPVARARWTALRPESRTTAVIVVDRSYSMGVEEAGRTRFEKARDAVLQILAGLGKGDDAALVLAGEQVRAVPPEPTGNLQQVARDMSELTPSGSTADLARACELARGMLDQVARGNRELYVVCDRQAINWRWLEGDAGRELRRWLAAGPGTARFYVVPVGGEETDNLVIESVELVDGVAVKGVAAEVQLTVRNYSPSPYASVPVQLSALSPADGPRRGGEGGRRLGSAYVTIPARGLASVRVPVVFEQPGSHVLTAEIRAGELAIDNRMDTAVDVIDPVQVLVLSGDERSEEFRRESFFLRLALAPRQAAQKRSGDPAVVTVRGIDEWSRIDLDKHQVVILANVPQVSAEQARALEQKVYQGGGLIIAPGNLVRVDAYNAVLYRYGEGLMPAELDDPLPGDGSSATTLARLENHPVFRFRRTDDPLPDAVIGRHFPAFPRFDDVDVLGTYADGSPFLIEGPRGRGRVLLLTVPLDADWSGLPLHPFYLPFAQSAVRYAASGSPAQRNLSPGDVIVATFDEGVDERSVRLWCNDEPLPAPAPAQGQVVFSQTQRPGVYRLEARLRSGGVRRVLHYVVQAPREESDLTPLTEADWKRLEQAVGFSRLNPETRAVPQELSSERQGRELWLWLVLAAMSLGLGELWLARRWSREEA